MPPEPGMMQLNCIGAAKYGQSEPASVFQSCRKKTAILRWILGSVDRSAVPGTHLLGSFRRLAGLPLQQGHRPSRRRQRGLDARAGGGDHPRDGRLRDQQRGAAPRQGAGAPPGAPVPRGEGPHRPRRVTDLARRRPPRACPSHPRPSRARTSSARR